MCVRGWHQRRGVMKNADRDKDLPRKIVVGCSGSRPALRAMPAFSTRVDGQLGAKIRRCGNRLRVKCGKDRNRRAGPAAAIRAMAIHHRAGRAVGLERNRAAIAPPGKICDRRVRRQPGAPLSLRGYSGEAGSRYPFLASSSTTGSQRRRPSYANRRRRGRIRGR